MASPIPETRYARSGDVSIAYQVTGEGPIDLVVVPGTISHLEVLWEDPAYARFMGRLAEFSRLIMLDKRGMGLSERVQVANARPWSIFGQVAVNNDDNQWRKDRP